MVGLLAQHVYGYKPISEGSEDIATDRGNAASLARALYTAIGVPMALCCFIYSFLYRTYPRDRERAKMDALIESEMQMLESDGWYPRQLPELKELYLDEQSIVEIDYEGGRESLDFGDDDEKTVLYRQLTFSNLG